MTYTDEDLERVAGDLFAYKEGDFAPDHPRARQKWNNADAMMRTRYLNLAKTALDSFTSN